MKVLQNLLVDLDVLVDTPAAFAFTHWPAKYAKVDIDTYRTYRQDDLWTLFDVPKDEWISKWQSRDASILKQGLPTEFSINFDRILAGNVIQGKVSPVHEEVTVTVNLYPYVVSAEVKAEIQTALNELLGYLIPVTLVFLPTALLTPSYLKENYPTYVTRDHIGWLNAHPELGKEPIPTVMLYYPARIDTSDKELLKQVQEETANPFLTTKAAMADFITMEALDVELFSQTSPFKSSGESSPLK